MITVYSKPGCGHCDAAKNWLADNNFEFNTIDVTAVPEALAFVLAQGHKTVPQLYIGDQLFIAGGVAGLISMTADEVRSHYLKMVN